VVRSDSPFETLADTFGAVAGYTLADSLSGGVAFDRFLETFRTPQRRRLYRQSVGPLIHARGVIEALARGEIDVGPLDSYYHDLLRYDEPDFAAQVRTIATTPMRPIPPLVASVPLTADKLHALRQSLHAAMQASELELVRARILLAGFEQPDPADYGPLRKLAALTPDSLEEL
jgi:ABC-type phosphate/phosphonate transport system substrate-binding protein